MLNKLGHSVSYEVMPSPKSTRKSALFKSQKKNQNQKLESNPVILQLHGVFYT